MSDVTVTITQRADPLPQVGLLTSSEVWRVNSTGVKISEHFERARYDAMSEALWLSAIASRLIADNDQLRILVARQEKELAELRKQTAREVTPDES